MKIIPGGISMSNQMSLIRDTEEVVKFLEFAGKKLILDPHAVNCRLTACHNLFSVVNDEEDGVEFMLSNLDLLINRLRNKNKGVNESTLKVYKSRLKSSLDDYKAWAADPFAWERSVTEKSKIQVAQARKAERKQSKTPKGEVSRNSKVTVKAVEGNGEISAQTVQAEVERPASGHSPRLRRLNLPIRNGVDVEVVLPTDGITLRELQRIGLFLYPYCTDSDENRSVFQGLTN